MKLDEFVRDLKKIEKNYTIEDYPDGKVIRIAEARQIPYTIKQKTFMVDASGESVFAFNTEEELIDMQIFDEEETKSETINSVQTLQAQGLIGDHEHATFQIVNDKIERKKIC